MTRRHTWTCSGLAVALCVGMSGVWWPSISPVRLAAAARPPMLTGRIVDATTHRAIAGAIVTAGDSELRADEQGLFSLQPAPAVRAIGVRAYGYGRVQVSTSRFGTSAIDIALSPVRPKALYLSIYGIGSSVLRDAALNLVDASELNAVVIDVKGDRGLIAYRSAMPLATSVGAQTTITIKDLPALIAELHARGLYTIARIVVFKDDALASSRADLALHRQDGSLFRDREGLAWADLYKAEVRSYNVGVAKEAAAAGFDEIQFDYTRLPDAKGLSYPVAQTEANRQAPIEEFLREARRALTPYNVFLAVDIFGYVCWNTDDTHIGQKLESIVEIVDYVSPMLYPSSFQFGIPGYRQPVEQPYAIVRLSLERAVARTQVPPIRFRPWLQAFRDYAFDGRSFDGAPLANQIKAADDVGTSGWMLWNPRNRYSQPAPTE